MIMRNTFTRLLTVFAAVVMAIGARGAAPGQPALSVVFELTGEHGTVAGTVTAPLTDMYQNELPADASMGVTIFRSAYSLGQNNLTVDKFEGVKPGESRQFTDRVTPAWEFNEDYTYTAVVTLAGHEFYTGYSGMNPGLDFMFPKNALTLTPALDGKSVTMTVTAPSEMTSGLPLEEPMTLMEFYRAVDTSSWPYKYALLHTVANPSNGEEYSFTDDSPKTDATNYYRVRAVTKYGYADTQGNCYVGLDVPAAPYPVTAEEKAEGVLISWTAPDRGENWGAIDPAGIWYNVYRCRDYGAANRELIAERITETSYVDTGSDLESPLEVRYEVQAGNERGLGGSNYSASDFNILVGPAYTLPFQETFDGGLTKIWRLESTSYYARWYEATEGEYGSRPVYTVKPVQGTGLIYVDFVYNDPAPGTVNTMSSYKIALEGAVNPYVSFWYYGIPDNDVKISVAGSDSPSEFGEGTEFAVAGGVEKPEWRHVWAPLSAVAGKDMAYLRFSTTFTEKPSSAIIDDVQVMDYPPVSHLDAVADRESMSVELTWELPTYGVAECKGFVGYVDGVEIGEVTSPWLYEGLEMDKGYTFQVRALYEGVEVAPSPMCGVKIDTPRPTEFTVGDYDYVVLDIDYAGEESAQDATALPQQVNVAGYHGRGGLLRMPAEVTFMDEVYKVTGVAAEVFRGNADVESVALPEGYGVIGEKAFAEMPALEAVSIPASMTIISSGAFAGCSRLASVSFAGPEPPLVAADAFTGLAEDCKGTCPEESVDKYKAVAALSEIDFGDDDDTSVDMLLADPSVKAEYFDFTGRALRAPADRQPYILRLTLPDGTVRVVKRL